MEEMKTLNKVSCIISKEGNKNGWHDLQTNSSWTNNPYGDDYAIVPDDLVEAIMETCGFCDIELNEDETEVVSFTAREIPKIPEQEVESEVTTEDVLNALLGVE